MNWTDENCDRLRGFVDAGLSCSQIARELGATRNAVIGKVHRLGLVLAYKPVAVAPRRPRRAKVFRPPPQPQPQPQPSQKHSRYTPMLPRAANMAERIQARAYDPGMAEPDIGSSSENVPVGQRCSLMELSNATCRWPIGDVGSPEFYFCGATPAEGFPYCKGHCRRAFNPKAIATKAPWIAWDRSNRT